MAPSRHEREMGKNRLSSSVLRNMCGGQASQSGEQIIRDSVGSTGAGATTRSSRFGGTGHTQINTGNRRQYCLNCSSLRRPPSDCKVCIPNIY